MADPNDTLDPEPVDAEFEPADDSRPAGKPVRKGPGWLSLFTVFLLASAAGGAIGYAGQTYFGAPVPSDDGAAAERAALTDAITALESRLATVEGQLPEGDLSAVTEFLEAGDQPDFAALEARLTSLENAPAATAGSAFDPAPLERRLDRLEAAIADVDALANQALDGAQASTGNSIDPQVLQNITQRLAALEQAGDTGGAPPAVSFDDPAPQIEALDARIAGLESDLSALGDRLGETRSLAETAQSAADTATRTAQNTGGDDARASRTLAARALALTALREIAMTGEGFEAERAALARLWRDNADLEALAPVARAGVPTLDQLAANYPGSTIREAAGPGRIFFGLIEVRQAEAGDDETGALAITALAEDRLSQDDLDGAIALTERLEGDALEAARDWLISARARQDLDLRLTRLRQALADDATAQGADPL